MFLSFIADSCAALSRFGVRRLPVVLLALLAGCGTIREKRATEQILLSDAVDRSVSTIDFSPLGYKKVFLDTRYLQFKNESVVTTNYVISALRQQMVAAHCYLQDGIEDADYVAEARVGALGSNGHEINYGVPPSNTVNAAASLVTNTPLLPSLPEISLGRTTKETAAAKIAVFAYDKQTRRPIWNSGTKVATSEAKSWWILGAGPYQSGEIFEGSKFVTEDIDRRGNKAEEDYFHAMNILDEDLQRQVANGEHLLPPGPVVAETTETTEEVAEAKDGEEQR